MKNERLRAMRKRARCSSANTASLGCTPGNSCVLFGGGARPGGLADESGSVQVGAIIDNRQYPAGIGKFGAIIVEEIINLVPVLAQDTSPTVSAQTTRIHQYGQHLIGTECLVVDAF